ncbi:FG-GAP-like repeat-containing protein [Streptomyces sp. S.PNR 29]|uniref:FG-GAP-like repeat-containing protein n=1 Tax=Streptomyces sp. S.PNR 29 TaxID=2973805 RepID=UPI0025B1BD75|nr:FG-GAP-like repeat-containing protein [Streptomyces sp. S.PNR 29]MDN0200973.1 FG-GAP-like repeat-containing protein [Streptomyces sp. S.PNR 29]
MSKRRIGRGIGLAAAVAVIGAVIAPVTAHAAESRSAATELHDDFNGDGYQDVAFAAPGAKVDGQARAGYVAVVYGSANGLNLTHRQVISQNTAGIPGTAEADDRYGDSLAAGDMNGDGYADLVVGASGEEVAGVAGTGSLAVVWGGPQGLSGATAVATGALAGAQSAIGDFDGDGHLDLATPSSLLTGPFDRTTGAASAAPLRVDTVDYATNTLAAGDVDGDGITDLVALNIDSTDDDYSNPDQYHRRVLYLRGTGQGLSAPVTLKNEDGTDLRGGESLGIGDVDQDGYGDLVIGRSLNHDIVDEDLLIGGQIGVVYGSAAGPDTSREAMITQDSPGVPGATEWGDSFGGGISVGDVNGDGYADVATGAFTEGLGEEYAAGQVTVLRGSGTGLTGAGAVAFNQDTANVPGTAERNDFFGARTALIDTNRDGRAELIVGSPGENLGAGSLWAFPNPGTGPTATGSVSFGAGTLGTVADRAGLGSRIAR